MKAIIKTTSNTVLTQNCFEIIFEACNTAGYDTELINSNDKLVVYEKGTLYFVSTIFDAMKLSAHGVGNIAIWIQGIYPEESIILSNNRLKFFILRAIENHIMRKCKYYVFASRAMKEHYERIYNIRFKNNYTIMPCYNCEIEKKSFYYKGKYKKNTFVYAGSLIKWQCFNETVRLYSDIENSGLKDVSLIVLTKEIEAAEKIIKEYRIKNYVIDYVEANQLSNVLKMAKYGFILREDNEVNRVATPTKLSSYISNGIIPIYSACIQDFNSYFYSSKYKVAMTSFSLDEIENSLEYFDKNEIKADSIFEEYNALFINYYSNTKYVDSIKSMLRIKND